MRRRIFNIITRMTAGQTFFTSNATPRITSLEIAEIENELEVKLQRGVRGQTARRRARLPVAVWPVDEDAFTRAAARALGKLELTKPTPGEVLDALEEMVWQHCFNPARIGYPIDHGFLSANEFAFTIMERAGRLRRLRGHPSQARIIRDPARKKGKRP